MYLTTTTPSSSSFGIQNHLPITTLLFPQITSSFSSLGVSKIKFFEAQKHAASRSPQFSRFYNYKTSLRYSTKPQIIMAQSSEPSKLRVHMDNFRERLWEAFPGSAKEFPWKRTEEKLLQRLFFLGEKTLKWSLIAIFIVSLLSDIILSFSTNRELMIPIGLFVGCMMADFLKETTQELFSGTEVGVLGCLVGVNSFFVLVKFVSVYFAVGGRVSLSHVGNGGVMQVLWLWKKLQEERESNEDVELSYLKETLVANVDD
ncbi:hypothetical protein GIB67_020067 [Kingdonia uniflora]|uniref:Uncharacterized protein n=1 Tax=Kingdonia uniflora TaxID=39325 RepID=A0A7J7L2A3_9MAGN|nr:hypothetical protein GIB67_020067 [Kingdonia uniflora]